MRRIVAIIVAQTFVFCSIVRADNPRTISTHGESVVYVTPDLVTVNLGVTNWDKNLADAIRTSDESSASLIKAIRALGIDDKDVQVAQLVVDLTYGTGWTSTNLSGYQVSRSYTVRLKNTDMLKPLFEAALQNGANQVLGIQFDSAERPKYSEQARLEAIRQAKQKALTLAEELQCNVGAPLSISEGGGTIGYAGNNNYAANSYVNMSGSLSMGGTSTQNIPVGQLEVSASVDVTFELLDAGSH